MGSAYQSCEYSYFGMKEFSFPIEHGLLLRIHSCCAQAAQRNTPSIMCLVTYSILLSTTYAVVWKTREERYSLLFCDSLNLSFYIVHCPRPPMIVELL